MRGQIFYSDENGRKVGMTVSATPDVCPTCHHKVQPQQLLGILEGTAYEGTIEAVYRCPNTECRTLFFARFTRTRAPDNYPDCFMYRGVGPWSPEKIKWPDEIEALSPRFVEVYTSAMAAEKNGLDDLVGMGLRKALEFLIKDFAIATHPDKAEVIRKTMLGPVIEAFCDGKVKDVARRATWLGNDETHYERIWVAQDVNDLKVLIRLTVGWIKSEILTGHYKSTMPDKKKLASS